MAWKSHVTLFVARAVASRGRRVGPSRHQSELLTNVLPAHLVREQSDVSVGHDAHQFGELCFWDPAQLLLGLGSVANQYVDFCRAIIFRIDLDILLPFQTGVTEREVEKVSDGVDFPSGNDIIVGFV